MSSVSDHIQIMKSQEKKAERLLEKREWLYINDTTNNYDQGISIIETTSLSNNSKYLDYNAGYLSVPLLITLTSSSGVNNEGLSSTTPATKSIGFKQSFLSMINSITVDLNGQPMVQQNQLIDVYNHFRLLTSESWTSQNRWSSIGFYPDVAGEAGYDTANSPYAPANLTTNNTNDNAGLVKRLEYVFSETDLSLGTSATSPVSGLLSQASMASLYMSHISKIQGTTAVDAVVGPPAVDAVTAVAPCIQYSVKATIMLKDIHPIFESIPISKSLNFKIQIFWNQSVITATHDGTNWTGKSSEYRAYNGTLPLMLNNVSTGFAGTGAGTIRASVYVGNSCLDSTQNAVSGSGTGAVGKQVELWVPAIQMLPDVEDDYARNHLRDVSYYDYYQYTLKNIEAGGTFNHLVSNAVSNLKACLIVPLSNTLNNNVNPFDDGLPQQLAHINNFNVVVGGVNTLHQDSRYTYQSFNNEFFNEFGINGNQSAGLGSSLIDFKSWINKPYYYVNCSRVPLEQQMAYRSLQIKGTNLSAQTVDYLIYAIYEKNFQMDVVSGVIKPIK